MIKPLVFIAVLSLLSFSCEKVIDIPLNEADVQVIVEGKLYDLPQSSFIKLSKSGSVYDDSGFEKISGATVTVTDTQGGNYLFTEDPNEPGKYIDTTFVTQPNTTYNLTVNTSEGTYTAVSYTQSDIQFDSLDYIVQNGGFGQQTTDTTFFTFFNFTDNANEKNYYRIIPYVNNQSPNGEYLTEDELYNGNNFRQPFFAEQMKKGDTLVAVIISMDEPNYKFFSTLGQNADGGPFAPAPANPVSNIEGGAIGYFGAFMTGNEMLVYPQ
jgi:hypothetical protein